MKSLYRVLTIKKRDDDEEEEYNTCGGGYHESKTPRFMKKKRSSKNHKFDDDEELHISSPTLLSRTTSRVSPIPSPNISTTTTPRSTTTPPMDFIDSIANRLSEVSTSPITPREPSSLSKVSNIKSTTPIFYSQSAVRKKPPPIEKKLECTLEELCLGCVKKIKITRDAISSTGLLVQEEEIIMINVKPGWKKGTKITFEGKGDEVPGALPADIVFVVDEKRHHMFKREGDDLELGVKVPLIQALAGSKISIPLLGGGTTTLSIDDIIHPGHGMIIPGQGMPKSKEGGNRGNLRLKFMVGFPSKLSDKQRSEVVSILEECS